MCIYIYVSDVIYIYIYDEVPQEDADRKAEGDTTPGREPTSHIVQGVLFQVPCGIP